MRETATENTIHTCKELISRLQSAELFEFGNILNQLSLDALEVKDYLVWKDENYTRNCIYRDERFEVIVLCWQPGQDAPIHDHASQLCWVYQMSGIITETRYKLENGIPKTIQVTHLHPGELSFINDDIGLHSVKNTFDQNAISLYIYASPIDTCNTFNTVNADREPRILGYDNSISIAHG